MEAPVRKQSKFLVEGGVPLKGEVSVSGAKNAAIKMIAASLLTSEEIILDNVAEIDDVFVMVEAAQSLGVKAEWIDNHKLSLKSETLNRFEIEKDLSCRARSTVMFMAPLLGRFGQFTIGEPGGCSIGKKRPINRHLSVLEKMGAEISFKNEVFSGRVQGDLHGAEILFERRTVMGTETAILAAVLAKGKSQIFNAAEEPEVDDLILLLTKMGARIERNPGGLLIEGVQHLYGAVHEILPDRNETVTFAIAAALTGGDILIERTRPSDLTAFLAKIEKVGVGFEAGRGRLRVWANGGRKFQPVDVETSPQPGFMTDWQQPFCVLLCAAEGQSRVHETIYVNRFGFVKELNRMGAKIDVVRPSEVGLTAVVSDDDYNLEAEGEPKTVAIINGPAALVGRRLTIPDLRAGATLVLAALAARGRSEIFGIEHIDRGYETFDAKLRHLGARIERLSV